MGFFDKKESRGEDDYSCGCSLYFKTAEIRDQFLNNFRGLIEEAKEFV